MRKLNIKRIKRFVACTVRVKVYIEDPMENDLTINGCACRFLGTLKNGESATFSVSEAEARVYVIADKLSKDYCNDYYTLPAGVEDVTLTGRNNFDLASGNAFRFDGVGDKNVLTNRVKGRNKGAVVLIAAIIIGLLLGGLGGSALMRSILSDLGKPQEFIVADLRITLTDKFHEVEVPQYTAAFESKQVAVFVLKETRAIFESVGINTLTEYAQMVQKANGHSAPIQEDEYFLYYEYSYKDYSSGNEYYYFTMMYKNPVDFYIVQFAVPEEKIEEYRDTVMEWARSVKVN